MNLCIACIRRCEFFDACGLLFDEFVLSLNDVFELAHREAKTTNHGERSFEFARSHCFRPLLEDGDFRDGAADVYRHPPDESSDADRAASGCRGTDAGRNLKPT